MNKTFEIALNKFPTIPKNLRDSSGACVSTVTIDTDEIQRLHWLDNFPSTPASIGSYVHAHCLSTSSDFRFAHARPATNSGMSRDISRQLGHVICRWFMEKHCNIVFFAHIEKLLDKPSHPSYPTIKIERQSKGDAPDYFCSTPTKKVLIAEAKGRYSSISFGSKQFNGWEEQFKRIVVKQNGIPTTVKGVIVGTRIATAQYPSTLSTIYAQDPETDGEQDLNDNNHDLAVATIVQHYANVLRKIDLGYLALCFSNGYLFPRNRLEFVVLESIYSPLAGKKFVGVVFHPDLPDSIFGLHNLLQNGELELHQLQFYGFQFFGLNLDILKGILSTARGNWDEIRDIKLVVDSLISDGMVVNRDGTIVGNLSSFKASDMLFL